MIWGELLFSVLFCLCLESGSQVMTQDGLNIQPRITVNFRSSCPDPLSAGKIVLCHHTQLMQQALGIQLCAKEDLHHLSPGPTLSLL